MSANDTAVRLGRSTNPTADRQLGCYVILVVFEEAHALREISCEEIGVPHFGLGATWVAVAPVKAAERATTFNE